MAKDEAPVKFTRPEDDPALARLVDTLKKGSADGDPLYVEHRKRGMQAHPAEKASAPDAPVVAELRRDPAPSSRAEAFPRWMPVLVLAIVGPAVVLVLALMLARAKAPIVVVSPSPSIAVPAPSVVAGSPATATATPAMTGETSTSAMPPSAEPPAPDAGAPGPLPSVRPRPRTPAASTDGGAVEPPIAPDFVQ